MNRYVWIVPLLLAAGAVRAEETAGTEGTAPATGAPATVAQAPVDAEPPAGAAKHQGGPEARAAEGAKELDGMSILGNQEAPKSLVIVPWKGSELGSALGIAPMLDDSRQPVDREVFLRSLGYYEIRSETWRLEGGQSATAARRSKS